MTDMGKLFNVLDTLGFNTDELKNEAFRLMESSLHGSELREQFLNKVISSLKHQGYDAEVKDDVLTIYRREITKDTLPR
jgi:hypothetical protein